MAAITIQANISKVLNDIAAKLGKLKDKDYLLRPVAIETIANMKQRIHKDGKASNGGQIGTYSKGYLALRQAKYNRSADTKVIVALTSQLENDWAVLATTTGYGIGFNNPFNAQKARWVEQGKGTTIFKLTDDERQYATERLEELTQDAIDS